LEPPDADRHVILLRGEHDSSTVAALAHTLARAIAADHADLVLDLSGVQFMDAATVGVIVRAREFLGERLRCLTLRSPSTCAARTLKLCGVEDRTAVARGAAVASRAGP
jgi:anti-anti-sigma factor